MIRPYKHNSIDLYRKQYPVKLYRNGRADMYDIRPGVEPELWPGLANALMITAFVGLIILAIWLGNQEAMADKWIKAALEAGQ